MQGPKHTNRLASETSPYLLQHAHNPVDWYPWGEEAIKKAKREDKPIFLSIGYSACHWCHVMERESFEDEETAALLNAHFVSIKVDREERPDLDHIYMSAVQAMTQHGGWPMSVFLTPDLEPFYGGTYFPKADRLGLPSFKKILLGVSNAWRTRKEEVRKSAKQLVSALDELNRIGSKSSTGATLSYDIITKAVDHLAQAYDPQYGGLGNAPKFFHTMAFRLFLRHWRRQKDERSKERTEVTLARWRRGGIRDQLGGGFHRYSTDREWLVPHFEKMLYDNALLAELYLEAFQATQRPEWEQTARDTLDYVLRDMTSPEGAFYSTQDADSEGVEGKYYIWSKAEVVKLLDPELSEPFCYLYDVTEQGNWEGHTILREVHSLEEAAARFSQDPAWLEDGLATARRKLLAQRAKRPAPLRDEKILTSWNGLMVASFAKGYQVLGDDRYREASERAARFILEKMTTREKERGLRLLHAYKDKRPRFTACLDDYANTVYGLLALYQATFDPQWASAARELADVVLDQFTDSQHGSFFYTGLEHERLITRVKDFHDGATPSGTAMAVTALLGLGQLTGEARYHQAAEKALATHEALLSQTPSASAQMLIALDTLLAPGRTLVIVPAPGDALETTLEALRRGFRPELSVLVCRAENDALPLAKGKRLIDGKTAYYLCEGTRCYEPTTDLQHVLKMLDA